MVPLRRRPASPPLPPPPRRYLYPPYSAANSNADFFVRIRNPDGAEAGACGYATRCLVICWRGVIPAGFGQSLLH